MKYLNNYFESLGARYCLLIALVAALGLGFVDFLLGPQLSFSVFYIAPIMFAAWYGGKLAGTFMAVTCAGLWLAADLAAGSQYTTLFIPIWNTLVRLTFFVIILWLQLIVREKLAFEESLADTDPLTGLANRRFFLEQLQREITRVSRYPKPVTIAYLDLDNFKFVNDSMGHDVGDELLRCVAQTLNDGARASDFVTRLGGDEFCLLFPLLSENSALAVLKKIQAELLIVMNAHQWPVTFSIGALTFSEAVGSSRDVLKRVDDLMYDVKRAGKNDIRHIVWTDQVRNLQTPRKGMASHL